MDAEGVNTIDSLPDEALLMIFRFLREDDLQIAEQVCVRWKAVVNATAKRVKLSLHKEDDLNKLKLFGPSLKCLKFSYFIDDQRVPLTWSKDIDWINEIGNSFPNLQTISIYGIPMWQQSLRVLPIKCPQLTKISLCSCNYTDEDLGIVLKGFPGLKRLKLDDHEVVLGECFQELGSNIEQLKLGSLQITPAGISHILSRCRNLQALEIDSSFKCDASNLFKFCEGSSTLRTLSIIHLYWSKEAFLPIASLHLLEELDINGCEDVDSEVLIDISVGCPILKRVHLFGLPDVCDRGLKALAQCTHLTDLMVASDDFDELVTDKSLYEFADAGVLESLSVGNLNISDRGLTAILARCPHLVYLDVSQCSRVGDRTVDAAIQAVESRPRLSTTRNQIPHSLSKFISQDYVAGRTTAYLLWLRLPGKQLKRYNEGFSHPLLNFQVNKY